MGLSGSVESILAAQEAVAIRPATAYAVGAGQTIFTVTGGAVRVILLFGFAVTALDPAAAGMTFTMTAGGLAIDSGALACATAINMLVVSPIDTTGLTAMLPNVAAATLPIAVLTGGLLMAPGIIALTVGVAPTVGLVRWYMAYHRLDPSSEVN